MCSVSHPLCVSPLSRSAGEGEGEGGGLESSRRTSSLIGIPRLHFNQLPSPALSGTLSRAAVAGFKTTTKLTPASAPGTTSARFDV